MQNGTPLGMIKNLFEGTADMIGTSFTMTSLRAKYVKYLPVIDKDTHAIFIRSSTSEKISFTTFVNPFSVNLWLMIIGTAMIVALWLTISTVSYERNASKVSDSITLGD